MANLLDSITSTVNAIFNVVKWSNDKDLLEKIGNLQMQLYTLKNDYAALQDENKELKAQRQEDAENPLSISPCGIYFDTHKNPFCAGCYDGHTKRRVNLVYKGANVGSVRYVCPVCKTEYIDQDEIGPLESLNIRLT
jgi:predicted Zn-ribbon and HTH transcriptional regulator